MHDMYSTNKRCEDNFRLGKQKTKIRFGPRIKPNKKWLDIEGFLKLRSNRKWLKSQISLYNDFINKVRRLNKIIYLG